MSYSSTTRSAVSRRKAPRVPIQLEKIRKQLKKLVDTTIESNSSSPIPSSLLSIQLESYARLLRSLCLSKTLNASAISRKPENEFWLCWATKQLVRSYDTEKTSPNGAGTTRASTLRRTSSSSSSRRSKRSGRRSRRRGQQSLAT